MAVVCVCMGEGSSGPGAEMQILASVCTASSCWVEGHGLLYSEGGSEVVTHDPDPFLCSPIPVSVSAFLLKPMNMSMGPLSHLAEGSDWVELSLPLPHHCSEFFLPSMLPVSWFAAGIPPASLADVTRAPRVGN